MKPMFKLKKIISPFNQAGGWPYLWAAGCVADCNEAPDHKPEDDKYDGHDDEGCEGQRDTVPKSRSLWLLFIVLDVEASL